MTSPIDALRGVTNANQASPTVITGGQPSATHFRALGQSFELQPTHSRGRRS